ncbi:MAG: glycosyltransferase family 4 protein [Acidobacteriia bacterium]|nr:glycosyltransferase family 4 protein [Terriglobia bacterium]
MARKVCVLTSAHPPTDVRIFHKECKTLARAGYQVTLIATADNHAVIDGVTLTPLPRWKSRFGRILRGPIAAYQKALDADADIYHFHDPELIPVALLLQGAGKTVIYDIHEDVPRTISYKTYLPGLLKEPISRIAEIIENWAGARFSALVAANPIIGDRFLKVNENTAIVNNYPRIEELESSAEAPADKRESILLYVGMRITRARGAHEMVRAVGLLPDKLHARLNLVGAWDPPDLQDSLSAIPGWDRTTFVGPLNRPGVARELHQARVGLLILHPEPNYVTSHPVKLFEYMCAGIPVIASDFPIWREIVTKSQCGILVDPFNAEQIAQAMEYLLTHPEEAAEMGRRGMRAVHDRYNWASEEMHLLQLYDRLSGSEAVYERNLANMGSTP